MISVFYSDHHDPQLQCLPLAISNLWFFPLSLIKQARTIKWPLASQHDAWSFVMIKQFGQVHPGQILLTDGIQPFGILLFLGLHFDRCSRFATIFRCLRTRTHGCFLLCLLVCCRSDSCLVNQSSDSRSIFQPIRSPGHKLDSLKHDSKGLSKEVGCTALTSARDFPLKLGNARNAVRTEILQCQIWYAVK